MDDKFMHVGTSQEIAAIIKNLEGQISCLESRVKFYKECLMDINYDPISGNIRIGFTDEQTEAAKRLGIDL